MDKSMYTLILLDELVDAVDRLAYENSASRSGIINQILAQHLSMITPEMRIAEIYAAAARVAASHQALQVQNQQAGSMLVVKSAIHYKYNPTIRYSVEITVSDRAYTGEFKVLSRSQSDALLSRLTVFYELWSQVEHTCLSEKFSTLQLKYSIAGGRFRRWLILEREGESFDSHGLGEAIGKYIGAFDAGVNLYFSARYGVDAETFSAIQELYRQYLREAPTAI